MVLVLQQELGTSQEHRSEMNAIYVWLNLGSNEAMKWIMQLPKELR